MCVNYYKLIYRYEKRQKQQSVNITIVNRTPWRTDGHKEHDGRTTNERTIITLTICWYANVRIKMTTTTAATTKLGGKHDRSADGPWNEKECGKERKTRWPQNDAMP